MLKKLLLASILFTPAAFAAEQVNVRCSCGRFLQFDMPGFADQWETVGSVTFKATFDDDHHALARAARPLCRKKYRAPDLKGFDCQYVR
jgi:hypothetical protein